MPSQTAIHFDRLTKRFKGHTALDKCTASIPKSATVALVGANGAGKSTLMSILAGVLPATSGEVVIGGAGPLRGNIADHITFLTQRRPLYRSFRVEEMIRATKALNREWDEPYARELIDRAQIDLTSRIRSLSGGQHSRVALALALARHPEVLLLDEPMSDLDPVARRQVRDVLVRESGVHGTTTIMSSHIISELADHCDHLLLLDGGHVVAFGRIDDLLAGASAGSERILELEKFVVDHLANGVSV